MSKPTLSIDQVAEILKACSSPWYVIAGGGFTTENSRHVITNGVATHEAILRLAKDSKLARPLDVDARERAKRSWDNWTAEDIKAEFALWPSD